MAAKADLKTPYIDHGKDLPKEKLPAATRKLLEKGWQIKTDMDKLKADLNAVNEQLIAKHTECSLVIPGLCRCPISAATSYKFVASEENLTVAKTLFGKDYKKYVERTVINAATKELTAIAKDVEHELHKSVEPLFDISVGEYSVRWSTAK